MAIFQTNYAVTGKLAVQLGFGRVATEVVFQEATAVTVTTTVPIYQMNKTALATASEIRQGIGVGITAVVFVKASFAMVSTTVAIHQMNNAVTVTLASRNGSATTEVVFIKVTDATVITTAKTSQTKTTAVRHAIMRIIPRKHA